MIGYFSWSLYRPSFMVCDVAKATGSKARSIRTALQLIDLKKNFGFSNVETLPQLRKFTFWDCVYIVEKVRAIGQPLPPASFIYDAMDVASLVIREESYHVRILTRAEMIAAVAAELHCEVVPTSDAEFRFLESFPMTSAEVFACLDWMVQAERL